MQSSTLQCFVNGFAFLSDCVDVVDMQTHGDTGKMRLPNVEDDNITSSASGNNIRRKHCY